ncbi:MAG: MBL fold metallo-hydrolase, partial [Hyphomicrobiales bacterium]|nr:MBL fold metallo-hydrolase [Hyphomicrobiales bacterium]
NALICDGRLFVVDAGYGVTMRMVEAGLPLPAIEAIFITHHHSDHTLELGGLIYNSWVNGRRTPVHIYGPPETKHLVGHFLEAFRFDIETRKADEGRPDLRDLVHIHEFADGEILRDGTLTVTALRNVHPPITDSFSLKFALAGKTVVFSGDTAYFPPLAAFASGADILVHEAMHREGMERLVQRTNNASRLREHLIASHTLAEDVGKLAEQAAVKTLALNHFVPVDDPLVTEDSWRQAVLERYSGDLIVGRDLMEIPF